MVAPYTAVDTFGNPISESGKTPVPQNFFVPTQTNEQRAAAIAAAGQKPVAQTKPPTEPAVISSGTVTDEIIPENNKRLDDLTKKGTYVGMDSNTYYSDGSLVPAPLDAVYNEQAKTWQSGGTNYGAAPEYIDNQTQDPQIANTNRILGALKSQLDASTASHINAIQKQYDLLRADQEDANHRAEQGQARVQLLSGSARYAPLAADGAVLAQTTYGLQQIQKLDAEEDTAIANVREAQRTGNYQIMEKGLATVESIRQDKIKTAQAVADALSKANQKMMDQKIQSSRDEAVATLFGQGITDPGTILKTLNDTGGAYSAKEVKDVIDAIKVKQEDTDLYKFSQTDLGTMLGSGLSIGQIQAVQDYYNGHGAAEAYTELKPTQQAAIQKALVGKTAAADTDTVKLTAIDKQALLGVGLSASDIASIEADVNAHGLTHVLEGVDDEAQKRALQKVYGAEDTKQFLDANYLESLFGEDGLKKAAADAGYRHLLTSWDTEKQNYLDSIMNTITQYRSAGYTDKEILKLIQS